tara:strand:+ start:85 stop:285 length:201 start_codon:yes stop_codon:yes gene_type:complete
MGKEKAVEICRNLKQTIHKYTHTAMNSGSDTLKDNSIWIGTKASKSMLQRKLDNLIKEHNINKKEL